MGLQDQWQLSTTDGGQPPLRAATIQGSHHSGQPSPLRAATTQGSHHSGQHSPLSRAATSHSKGQPPRPQGSPHHRPTTTQQCIHQVSTWWLKYSCCCCWVAVVAALAGANPPCLAEGSAGVAFPSCLMAEPLEGSLVPTHLDWGVEDHRLRAYITQTI